MACVADTPSIDLDVAGGVLTAEAIIDPKADVAGVAQTPNPLSVDADGLFVYGADGWLALPTALAYSSADGPTFVATTSNDLRAFIGPGDRIRLVQGTTKYFIVTAIAAGTLTLYGGTDYTLANAAITSPYFSKSKSPIGFPLAQDKWTEQLIDSTLRLQAPPVSGTWYNLGGLNLAIPIGAWSVEYEATVDEEPGTKSGTGNYDLEVAATLSTTNNGDSDQRFRAWAISLAYAVDTTASLAFGTTFYRRAPLSLAAKTTYYLNEKATFSNFTGGGNLILNNGGAYAIIRAICAYL